MTTGKAMALTRQIFFGKMMSLLFNTLSRLVIAFLSRSKCLLISWLQSPSAVILEPKKIFLYLTERSLDTHLEPHFLQLHPGTPRDRLAVAVSRYPVAYLNSCCLRVWLPISLNLAAKMLPFETLTGLGTPSTMGSY